MIEPFLLVALPVGAILGVVALLFWRRQRREPTSLLEEALAIALAYALALIALHRAASPLGVADTPLLLAAAAGGVAFLEGTFSHERARWLFRVALVGVSVFVVLSGAIGPSEATSLVGVARGVGYTTFLLGVWAAGVTLLPTRSGARPLLLALAVGAGVSALSSSAGAGPALAVGAAVGLFALAARLAAPPLRSPRLAGVHALVGALWVAALLHA